MNQNPAVKIPESKPFSVFEDRTQPSQACYNYAILFGINWIFFINVTASMFFLPFPHLFAVALLPSL